MEKFIVKKGFVLPATQLEVLVTPEGADPSELELTAEQRESLIGDGSLVPFEAQEAPKEPAAPAPEQAEVPAPENKDAAQDGESQGEQKPEN